VLPDTHTGARAKRRCVTSAALRAHRGAERTSNTTAGPTGATRFSNPRKGASMEEIGRNESIRVVIDESGTVIAEGDIDLAGGPLLEAAILRRESSEPVVIDLAKVEFIDSSGLRSLLGASRRASDRGTSVVLRRPSTGVVRLLAITGTTDQFRLESAEQ
jgi:anti-anti-sigma factor